MASGGGPRPLIAKGQDGSEMDVSRWVVVYPCYIDESKSRAGGRKLPKEACAGCGYQVTSLHRRAAVPTQYTGTDVHFVDMMGCCESLKLKACAEPNKKHPRDWGSSGRIRVQLKTDDGEFAHDSLRSREQIMRAIAQLLPEHPARKQRIEAMAQRRAQMEAQMAAQGMGGMMPGMPGDAAAPGAAGGKAKKPKKGKKAKKGKR